MSALEEIEFDAETNLQIVEWAIRRREKQWRKGIHETKNGALLKISEMSEQHLINTIKLFTEEFNTAPLEKELKKRQNAKSKN